MLCYFLCQRIPGMAVAPDKAVEGVRLIGFPAVGGVPVSLRLWFVLPVFFLLLQ